MRVMFPEEHAVLLRKIFEDEPSFPSAFRRLTEKSFQPGSKTIYRGPRLETQVLYLAALLNWLSTMPTGVFPPVFIHYSKEAPQPADLLRRLARAAPDMIELHTTQSPVVPDCGVERVSHHVRWYIWTEGLEKMQVWNLSNCGQGTTFVKRYKDKVFHIGSRSNSLSVRCTCGQLSMTPTEPARLDL